jgi:hypothetical protein
VGLVVHRVDLPDGEVSWTVLDSEFSVVRPVDRYLAHLSAVDQLARAHGDLRVATARTPASQQGQIVGPDDTPEA